MDFGSLPPEINSGLMYTGAGAAPLLAASAAWDALATELDLTATGYASVLAELTGIEWTGPSAASAASAAAPYVGWLQTSSAQAERTAMQAKSAAAAYEVAFAATVPPPVIAANRAMLAALVATNFFGQNTPAIMVTEARYAEMWAQDAAAMYTYAAASSLARMLTPFREPPPTTNTAGLNTQAGAVAQAAASASAAPHTEAVASTAAPTVNPPGLASFLNSPEGGLTVQALGWINQAIGDTTNDPFSYFTASYTVGANGFGYFREGLVRGGMAGYTWFEGLGGFNNLAGVGGHLGALGRTGLLGPNVAGLLPTAGMPQAYGIGALSVPPSWATAAAGGKPVAVSLAATSAGATPVAAELPPGTAMQEAMVGTMSGGGAASAAADSRDGRDGKNRRGKDEKEKDGERPAAALLMASGWLASTLAYNNRRRVESASTPLPLPPDWQEQLAANEFAWG